MEQKNNPGDTNPAPAAPAARSPYPRLHRVFVGGGHAHLYALSRIGEWVKDGGRVTVIAPGPFWYSGMGPGLLSGLYHATDDTVDIAGLVVRQGGTFIEGRVTRIDADTREIELEDGERVPYDRLSLNVGSDVPMELIPGAAGVAYPVKPVAHFARLRDDILAHAQDRRLRLVVVGAGPAGCEAIANARALLDEQGGAYELTLVTSDDAPLNPLPSRARRKMTAWLNAHAVDCRFGVRADRVASHTLHLSDGSEVAFDFLVLATGVRPSRLLADSGLPTAHDGSMKVNRFLQCVTHPEIIGGGDCIQYAPRPLDRVGVYAVRQGLILFHNLAHDTPRPFTPQKNYLLILNLGDGTGLLCWRGLVVRSRWAARFKHWLDLRFIRGFQSQI